MRATLRELDAWLANPEPGAEQIINGRTPHDRVQNLRKQAETRVRGRQLSIYNAMREEHESDVKVYCEVLEELLSAVETMRKDLQRGKADPEEVMSQIGQSMTQLRDLSVEAEAIERASVMAAEMVDKDPAEWEENQGNRFPAAHGGPIVSVGFLRGDEPSPFEGGE